ncbi:platelet-derived growth factor receptor alpha-like [Copidosoma floridanum]|uniref:platelet-derived growth factor receptor alpha-like n=1 Tax=Copidosoma floridanum TaxID=29053 RepID=UPI000C6F8764|nr:platelet-derived growth factor receptor alpha-like [Copidosoma floridanum]
MEIMSISIMQVKGKLQGVKKISKKWLEWFSILHWTALFLNIFLFSGCDGDKPQLSPNVTELVINEGEALEIKCTSNEYVKFYYPYPSYLWSALQGIVNRNAFFDPKIGFVLKNLSFYSPEKGFPSLTCKAYDGDITTKMMKFRGSYYYSCMSKPTVKIEGRQTVLVGSPLTVTCTVKIYVESSNIISWKTPQNSMQVAEYDNVDSITSKLIIKNVTYADKGNYTCQVRSSFDEQRSTNIFIEVHDQNSYISLTSNNRDIAYSVGHVLLLTVNIDAYPPPTISWLTSNGTEIVFGKNFRLPQFKRQYPKYPESNLMIFNVQLKDEGIYTFRANNTNNVGFNSSEKRFPSLTCKAYDADITTKTMTFSRSYNNGCMSKPTVKIEGRQTVFVGSSLTVTCTVQIYVESSNIISWKTPQNSMQVAENNNVDSVTSKLIIRNVTYADEGNYTCQVRSSFKEHRSTNIFIEIHDPNSYISLTSNNRDLIAYSISLKLFLTVNIDAYPPPTISWLTSNGTEIVFGKHFRLPHFKRQYPKYPESNLMISKVQLTDEGIYTFRANNTNGKQSRNGTYSELKVSIESFGRIICEACQAYHCNSREHTIEITDGVDDAPYGIIGPEEAYNGENITLICAAVEHDHQSVTWLDDQFQEITNSSKVHVTSKQTKFTIRRELIIYNISQSDEKDYHCKSYSHLKTAFSNSDANFPFNKAQNSNDSIEFRSTSYCDDLQPSWRSNYEGNYQNWNAECICSHDLLSWAYQVAHGMEYLSRRNILHCDLAARNILLSTNNIVKICDFGLAQTLYKDINYTRLHDVKLPFKWMAIESLRDGVFSTKSDIWSFGIVIWEFFTLAETPYLGMQASVVYQKLINGYRMGQPRYATNYLYNIMLNCWEDEPTLRPSFTKLSKNIGMLLDKSTRVHFEKLYQEYENINKEVDLKRENDYSTNMSSPDKVALVLPQQNYENRLLQVENPIYLCLNNNDRLLADTPRTFDNCL